MTELGPIVDDGIRPGKKKKGSIGSERYEVFITTEQELMNLLSLIVNYKPGSCHRLCGY